MKKLFYFLVLLVATTAVITSCDEKPPVVEDPKPKIDHNNFKGDIKEDVSLDPAKVYKLTGLVRVKNGGKLRIPAGTRIEAFGGTSSAIIVEQGGQIFVNGTANKPVVMTSGLAQKNRGDWGGLVICGRASANSGGGMSEVGDVPYGGNIDTDNSGTIRYLRIEYSGAAFSSEKEYNGFSLFGVGSGTIVEFVQIYECADDGIEFYGGTVNAHNIVITNVEDDMFDWTEGWRGNGNNWYGKNAAGFGNRGFEGDNWETDNNALPFSNPTLSNITLIGSGVQGNEPQGMELRRGTKVNINNAVIKDYNVGIRVSGDISQGWTTNGNLRASNIRFINCVTNINVGTNGNANAISINENATGAGNADNTPDWAQGWTVGL